MSDLILVLFLTVLNGLFAMSEISIVSAKKARLQQQMEKGSAGAAVALSLQENPNKFLSSVQIGITSIGILSGIVGEKSLVTPLAEFMNSLGLSMSVAMPTSSIVVIVFLTFLSVVFGELIPKTLGLAMAEKIAAKIAIPLNIIATVFKPIVWIFSKTSNFTLKLLGLSKIQQEPVSNEEIKQLMLEGEEAGVFNKDEGKLVANVLHMDDKSAVSIMTPRSELDYVDINLPFSQIREKILTSQYSKLLVVEDSLDNLLGWVHIMDILPELCSGEEFDLKKHLQAPLYLPMTTTISQVLEELKRHRREVAMIINEFSENWGIVTLNDIMEELVGDIDMDETEEEKEILVREDGSFLVDGFISIDKLRSELSLGEALSKFTDKGITTLNGYILGELGKVPTEGETIEIEDGQTMIVIEVVDMDKNCVDKVILKILKKEQNSSEN